MGKTKKTLNTTIKKPQHVSLSNRDRSEATTFASTKILLYPAHLKDL